jgi:quercetin dioxygenase-like cupin family protein
VDAEDSGVIVVPPGDGATLDFLSVTHKLTSRQTGGALSVFESEFEPGAGNRLHVHQREDEIGYVLTGAIEVRLPDRTIRVEAGGVTRLPKTIPHALRNPLETPSRYLFLAVPGGLDEWFDALAEAHRRSALDDETHARLSAEYGIGWLE